MPFSFRSDKAVQTHIKGFDIHEMLGTKMRAMFQEARMRLVRSVALTVANAC